MYSYRCNANDELRVEVVGQDGQTIVQRPLNVQELLQRENHSVPIADGVTVRLEDFNEADLDLDDDDDYGDATHTENEVDSSQEGEDAVEGGEYDGVAALRTSAPPGTTEAGGWYDVLNALREERRSGSGRRVTAAAGADRGRLTGSTPLKRFTRKSLITTAAATAAGASANAQSRRDVWASFAPPSDPQRNYRRLRYVSAMSAADSRHFRPTAVSCHAVAAYVNVADKGQRVLVYGGVSGGGQKVEHELYEFSLLTGYWRRLEGRQCAPAGHYGHAMVIAEPLGRLVVIGGVGLGGLLPNAREWSSDPLKAARAKYLLPCCTGVSKTRPTRFGIGAIPGSSTAGSGSAVPPAPHHIVGFVPYLFDMDLATQCWRAIQLPKAFPLAFHSAVNYGSEVFVFGGLTEELVVSGQLLAVNAETYAVRLIKPAVEEKPDTAKETSKDDAAQASVAPEPRYLHTAVRFGQFMIIYGGYSIQNEPRSDVWAFDLVNERWEALRCHGEAPARAGHAACVVGSRLLVAGGLEVSLEESTDAAPANTVVALNLVPTAKEEYLWQGVVPSRPALPSLVFSAAAPCGDDTAFVLLGGLTPRPKRKKREAALERRSGARTEEAEGQGRAASRTRSGTRAGGGGPGTEGDAPEKPESLAARMLTLDDGLMIGFPPKKAKTAHADEDEPHVNELGVEVDPNEMPEHFKTFVRRQEDFVKKRDATALAAMRKIALEEREAMEPTLYLTEDEIDQLLAKGEACCTAFTEYKMDTLPSNVPDRDTRIRIVEECVSLSRQVRDVIKSMKGSAPGVTAVKSKTHRRRAGQKFEDYSAAKPFRRAVVDHLLHDMNHQLSHMHTLNKALRTVEWEEKDGFISAAEQMQKAVNAVGHTVGRIMNKYISNRVEHLVKGVDKHKEVMRLLKEVVERNRRDKIFHTDSPNKERERVKREWAKGTAAAASAGGGGGGSGGGGGGATKPTGAARATTRREAVHAAGGASGPHRTRHGSMGAGYHADESHTTVMVHTKEWERLMQNAARVQSCARQLSAYCHSSLSTAAPAPPPPPTAGGAAEPPVSVAEVVNGAPTASAPFPPTLLPPPSVTAVAPTTGFIPVPAPVESVQPPPVAPSATTEAAFGVPPPPPPSALPVAPSALATVEEPVTPNVAGGATTKEILNRQSDALREKTAAVADAVAEAAARFAQTAEQPPNETAAGSGAAAGGGGTSGAGEDASSASGSGTGGLLAVEAAKPLSFSVSTGATAGAPPPLLTDQLPIVPVGVPPFQLLPPPITDGAAAAVGTTVTPPSITPVPALGTAVAAANTPHALSSPAAPAKAAEKTKEESVPPATDVDKHTLYLSALRPLLEVRSRLAAAVKQTALIRMNQWDGNDLAGAPQDEKVEKLCLRVLNRLTALVQGITASFLSQAGAKPPRKALTATSRLVGPGRGPARDAGSSGKGQRRAVSAKRSSGSREGTASHRQQSGTASSSHRPQPAQPHSTSRSSRSSSGSSYSSSFTSGYSSSYTSSSRSRSSRRSSVTGDAPPPHDTSAHPTGEAITSPEDHRTIRAIKGQTSYAKEKRRAASAAKKKAALDAETAAAVESARVLRPLSSPALMFPMDLATLPTQSSPEAEGAAAAASVAPLVPLTTSQLQPAPASSGPDGASITVIEVAPVRREGDDARTVVVPNVTADSSAGSGAASFATGGGRAERLFDPWPGAPRYANDWTILPSSSSTSTTAAHAAMSASPPAGSDPTCSIALARGAVVVVSGPADGAGGILKATHAADTSAPPTHTSALGSVAATAVALAGPASGVSVQLPTACSGLVPSRAAQSTWQSDPPTSITPGPFIVNAEYYRRVTHDENALQPPPPLPHGTGETKEEAVEKWAEADEDYFYFGRQPRQCGGSGTFTGPGSTPSAPSRVHTAAPQQQTGGEPLPRALAAFSPYEVNAQRLITVSPAVGSVVPSQRVTATVRRRSTSARAKTRSSTQRSASEARARLMAPTAASARHAAARADPAPPPPPARGGTSTAAPAGNAAATAANTARLPFKGKLTPGEQKILEARERLRQR